MASEVVWCSTSLVVVVGWKPMRPDEVEVASAEEVVVVGGHCRQADLSTLKILTATQLFDSPLGGFGA